MFRFIAGYFLCVILGWVVLQIPICQQTLISGLDHLFIAVSAISTTGLVTVDISKVYSFWGQLIIITLVQIGGVAYLVFNTWIVLRVQQMIVENCEHSHLPKELSMKDLFKQAIWYTLFFETLGCGLLYIFFRDGSIAQPLWQAVFHTISAFCTAGFSLFSSNLEQYTSHLGVNLTIAMLSLWGALGFFIWIAFTKKVMGSQGRFRFFARVCQSFTFMVMVGSTFLFLTNLKPFGSDRGIVAFFQTMSAITTVGFNTINVGMLNSFNLVILLILMLYGLCLTGSCLNLKGIPLFKLLTHRRLDASDQIFLKRIQLTFIIFLCALGMLGFSSIFLLNEKCSFLAQVFEAASALCSVGLSVGVTAGLSVMGKWVILILMLVGRSAILLLSFSIASRVFLRPKKTLHQVS